MIDRLKTSWPLMVAVAFAMFMAISGWEVQMAWPEEGRWVPDTKITTRNLPIISTWQYGTDMPHWGEPERGIIIPEDQLPQEGYPIGVVPRSEIDRLQDQIDALRYELDIEKARRRALEKAYEDFYRAFGHALELAH